MPACRDCEHLTEEGTCRIGVKSPDEPLRACVRAIMDRYAALLTADTRVLEVGCGAWSPVHDRARELGCLWEGIDVNQTHIGEPTIATRIASVAAIPFADASFDLVVATQSMEHWEEYRVELLKGLSEVFRVLRPGGWALVNVPIHFHGGYRFVLGDVDGLRGLLEPFADEIVMEPWRLPSDPLPPQRYHLSLYWHKPSLWRRTSYVLDIRARRRDQVPYFDMPPIGTWRHLLRGLRHRGLPHYVTLLVTALTRKALGTE